MAFPILHPFNVTVPAGTPIATPIVASTVFSPSVVDRIDWLFPPGCKGLVGIQIGARSVPVIPGDHTQFFIRSGDSSGYDLSDLPTTGDWSVIAYNTGSFPHTIQVTYRVHRHVKPEPLRFIIDPGFGAIGIGES